MNQAPRRLLADPVRLALAFWLALALALAGRTLLRPESHTVFPVFVAGSLGWWADEPLYAESDDLDFFRYPPTFAVAFTPFALLGLRAGGVAWAWCSAGVYLAGLWVFARDVLPCKLDRTRLALFLVLAGVGALRGLWNGQSNALVVGILLLGCSALVNGRWWTAAALLTTAFWLKLTPVAPVLLLAALWPRELLPRLAVTVALGAALPFLTRPPDIVWGHYAEWSAHLLGTSGERWPGFRDAWTAYQAWCETFDGVDRPFPFEEPLHSPLYRLIQLGAAGLALVGCVWLRLRGLDRPRLVNVTLAAGCAWLMLFGPAVEHATFAFLAPSLAWAALDREAWPTGRWLALAGFGLVTVLGWGGLTRPLADALPLVLAALPAGTALFAAWLVGYGRHALLQSKV